MRVISPFRILKQSVSQLILCIHFFYLLTAALSLSIVPQWPSLIQRRGADFLWPLYWAHAFPEEKVITSILILYLFGTLSAAWLPQSRLARMLAFLGLFFYHAWNNSFGKVGHSTHLYVLISLLWIFLPSALWHESQRNKKTTLLALDLFETARFLILLTYTLAGVSKCIAGIYQFLNNQPSIFSLDAMSRHIAARLLDSGNTSFLGPWLIQHPLVGFIMLWGAIYLQAFACLAYFRPVIAAPWAIGLALFHIGSYFTLTIHFPHNIILLTLFFILYKPVGIPPITIKTFLLQLPLWGDLLRFLKILK
ncbi:MAG: hypothetical protein NZM04_04625 [Methylacidiphilales bacterium]|nr:hypothetical protein [Candidatus Methylacidiphilales bacterium]MDW8350086.1 hypothetical protein [Verrucomicrobiae bacterium]